jgi:hypothetical protein
MSIGVAGGDVMAAQAPKPVLYRQRNVERRRPCRICQPHDVVPPGSAPEPVQKTFQRELSSLLGREARPVEKLSIGLDSGTCERPVGLVAPAAILVLVQRECHSRIIRTRAHGGSATPLPGSGQAAQQGAESHDERIDGELGAGVEEDSHAVAADREERARVPGLDGAVTSLDREDLDALAGRRPTASRTSR